MSNSAWQACARTGDRLGESVLWHPHEQALYWIDFYGPFVHRLKDGALRTWKIAAGQMIGSLVFADRGRLLLALDHGLYVFDPGTGATAYFADPKQGQTGIAYNDGKVDRAGRYWVGTYDIAEAEPRGIFYRVAADGTETVADSGFVVCNGPTFSPDNRTLYFSDSFQRRVLAYDLDGNISRRHTLKQFPADEGMPDGLAVDSAGNVWCALYGAGKVVCLDPSGKTRLSLSVPAANVTSLCFGGAELKSLYITTGWSAGTTEATKGGDKGGSVFVRSVECAGLPEPIFIIP